MSNINPRVVGSIPTGPTSMQVSGLRELNFLAQAAVNPRKPPGLLTLDVDSQQVSRLLRDDLASHVDVLRQARPCVAELVGDLASRQAGLVQSCCHALSEGV